MGRGSWTAIWRAQSCAQSVSTSPLPASARHLPSHQGPFAKSQQLHSEASEFWISHYGNQPQCWGIFLWSLSDCWPQISPAYIAWPFSVKPALAAVRAAYAVIER